MLLETKLTELLRVRYPILLAPMDIISGARLTAAVSNAGGFGILGAGYGKRAWLETELHKLRGLFQTGVSFGVGFITWSLAKNPESLGVALAAKPKAIMLSFGDPQPFSDQIKNAGALLICQVQSEDMAKEALEAGADVLVAQGTEAGGHGAARSSMDIVPAIVDVAAGRVPVVAAGGIADGRGVAASLALGAAGVLLGTRFYASQEADGKEEAKQRICAATAGETTRGLLFDIVRQNLWPAPFTGRCLINDFARRWEGREIDLLQNIDKVAAEYAAASAAGNFDVAAVIAGDAVGLINDIPPAAEIVGRLVAEATQILEGRRNSFSVSPAKK
jgi:nitronate monooxygenase